MKRGFFLMVLVSILLVSSSVLAGNFVAFQGNVKQGGASLSSGNLTVYIFDSQTGGSVVYNSTDDFDGAISDGEYDVLLGNGSNELNLNYGTKYYLEMFVNDEQFSFDGNTRKVFESAVGNISYVNLQNNIPASYINKSGGTNWVGTSVESILDTIYSWVSGINSSANIKGFGFNTTAELDNKYIAQSEESNLNVNSTTWWAGVSGWVTGWFVQSGNNLVFNETKLNATIDDRAGVGTGDISSVNTSGEYLTGGSDSGNVDILLNETKLNATIDARANTSSSVNASWNQTLADTLYAGLLGGNNINGSQAFNGGWSQGGLSIIGGNLFAQTVYVYNLSSLKVNEIEVNGSVVPATGFDNQFDIGSLALRWRDLFLGGSANISGNLSLGGGIIMWNASGNNYVFYNGSQWQEFGTGNGTSSGTAGIWTNNSGVATYSDNVSISGDLEVAGNVNITQNLTLGAGVIQWNSTGYIFYNGTGWQQFGVGGNSTSTTTYGEMVWKQYEANSSDGSGDFNVTGTNWATVRGVAVPYKVTNASGDTVWRMRFNIRGILSSTSSSLALTISGVTFKTGTYQSINAMTGNTAPYTASAQTNPGASTFSSWGTATSTEWQYSGDVELESKPTWAEEPSAPNSVWTENSTDNSIYYNTGDVKTANNITLGSKITFFLGAVIKNVLNGWTEIDSNVSVAGDLNVTGKLNLGNGTIWYNDSDAKFYYYNGTAWSQIGTGSGGGGSNDTVYIAERIWRQYDANSSAGPGHFNITGTGWTTTRGVAIPYQTTNASNATIWRMRFNVVGTSSSVTSVTLTFTGVNFDGVSNNKQALAVAAGNEWAYGYIEDGTSTFSLASGVASTSWRVSGDVELESMPTWASEADSVSTFWAKNTTTNEIYYNTANVGINKTNPEATLHVGGDVIIELMAIPLMEVGRW